ncbi:hypothetical protein ACLB1T_27470 [Escherichia coli]
MKIIAGITPADSGTLEIGGNNYARLTPVSAHGWAFISFPRNRCFPSLSIKESILLDGEKNSSPCKK